MTILTFPNYAVLPGGYLAYAGSTEPPRDFSRLDVRVGKIVDVRVHPSANEELLLHQVDAGEYNMRVVGSRLRDHYLLKELDNRLVLLVCNVYKGFSRGMETTASLLCAKAGNTVQLLDPPSSSEPGDFVSVPGYGRGVNPIVHPADPRMEHRKLIHPKDISLFDDIAVDLRMDSERRAVYRNIPLQVDGRVGFITTKDLADCQVTAVDCDTDMRNMPRYKPDMLSNK